MKTHVKQALTQTKIYMRKLPDSLDVRTNEHTKHACRGRCMRNLWIAS